MHKKAEQREKSNLKSHQSVLFLYHEKRGQEILASFVIAEMEARMKVIKCDLPNHKTIDIVLLGDRHLGDSLCDFKQLQEIIEEIRSKENMYCILGGDLMDAAIKTSVGDTYGANLQPMEQLRQCVKIFAPIANKVLCVHPGNHEQRIYRSDGIDITEMMCAQLGILDKYTPTTALVFVRFGERKDSCHHHRKQMYSIYTAHGAGGGKKDGGKINRLSDLAVIVDADIYCHYHTHLPVVFKKAYYRVSAANSSVQKVEKLFVNGGAGMDYGGYADTAGFTPGSKATPIIHLSGSCRDMKATL